jgi:hypothetical protein
MLTEISRAFVARNDMISYFQRTATEPGHSHEDENVLFVSRRSSFVVIIKGETTHDFKV